MSRLYREIYKSTPLLNAKSLQYHFSKLRTTNTELYLIKYSTASKYEERTRRTIESKLSAVAARHLLARKPAKYEDASSNIGAYTTNPKFNITICSVRSLKVRLNDDGLDDETAIIFAESVSVYSLTFGKTIFSDTNRSSV